MKYRNSPDLFAPSKIAWMILCLLSLTSGIYTCFSVKNQSFSFSSYIVAQWGIGVRRNLGYTPLATADYIRHQAVLRSSSSSSYFSKLCLFSTPSNLYCHFTAYPRKYVPIFSRGSLYSQRAPFRVEFDIAVDIELWIARERHTRAGNIPPYILGCVSEAQPLPGALHTPSQHSTDHNIPSGPLTQQQWALVNDFQTALHSESMETCSRCNERWFRIKLATRGNTTGICAQCRIKDKAEDQKPNPADRTYFYGPRNNMEPGEVPSFLPELTQVEEMLISFVHTIIEVRQVQGQQYFYRGHVAHFMNNIPKIYDRLPLLPTELDIIVLRPADTASQPSLRRQFCRDFPLYVSCLRNGARVTFLRNKVGLVQRPLSPVLALG